MSTRFGCQPAREILLRGGRSITGTARALDIPRSHVHSALLGICAPAPGLRTGLSELLGLPVEALFTSSALAATYDPSRGPSSSARLSASWAVEVPATRIWSAAVAAAAADPIDVVTDDEIISRIVGLLAGPTAGDRESRATESLTDGVSGRAS